MTVIVQHIETTWYKNERGAMHGTLRGKTPPAAKIPVDEIALIDEKTILHSLQYRRASSEVQEHIRYRREAGLEIGCLRVESSESTATIEFTWDYRAGGKPVRWQRGRKLWFLDKNQCCRIRYNGRLMLEHTWQYKITTFNIGVFDRIREDCFVKKTPNFCYENMVDLR